MEGIWKNSESDSQPCVIADGMIAAEGGYLHDVPKADGDWAKQ